MDTSPEIAGQAMALIQARHSQRNVSVYRKYLETGGFVRRQGWTRSRVTTQRQDRFIVMISLRNRHLTSIEIQNQLRDFHGVSVSARTIRRRLKERDMVPHKPANGPKLTRAHRTARLHFARTHLNRHSKIGAVYSFLVSLKLCYMAMMEGRMSTHVRESVLHNAALKRGLIMAVAHGLSGAVYPRAAKLNLRLLQDHGCQH